GRLVEDEDPRVGEERAREGHALALAEREARAALAELRLVAVLEAEDELVCADRLRGADDLLRARARLAEGDVLGHGAGEEKAFLRHDPELVAQRLLRHVVEVVAIDREPAARRLVEAREELRERRLAGACMADERGSRSGLVVEVDAVQNPIAELAHAAA